MNFLGKLFGFDSEQFNAWEIHWALQNNVLIQFVLAIMLLLTLWFFWTSLSRIRAFGKRILLFFLRVVVLGIVLLLIFQPQLELKKIQSLKNNIAVLLDDSKSMSIQTFPDEKPRIELVKNALLNQKVFFEKLKQDYELKYFLISDQIKSISEPEIGKHYEPKALNTDFEKVIQELAKEYKDKSLQGVLLFSDGADLSQNASSISAEMTDQLSKFSGPIHTIQAGSNDEFKDLAIEQVIVNDFGFINQPVSVSVVIRATGVGNKNIPLVLREGEKIFVSKTVKINEDVNQYHAELQFTPMVQGKHIYSLTVPLFSGESVKNNNHWDFQIKVVRDRIRVLHLNGRPSWDARFLREALTNNPKVDLLSFFILRTLTDDVQAPTTELSLIPFPSNLLFSDYLSSFDLVIFHNFKYKPFLDKKYLDNIKKFVEAGGAFLMIGGDLAFQEGGYSRTSVEDILPVKFKRNDKRYLFGNFGLQVSKKLSHHPILKLEPDFKLNNKIWNSMPPLQGLNVGLLPKAKSHVLISSSSKKGQNPILVSHRAGEGRTMVVANDTLWNWNFHRVGKGGSGRYYQKFWENVIAWMTGDPETLPIQIETDKEKYRENDKVLVQYKLFKEDYNPLPGAKVDLILESLPGHKQLAVYHLKTDERGEGRKEITPGKEGFYSVRVVLQSSNRSLSQESRFSIESPKVEFQKPLVNSSFLKELSKKTKGVYQVLSQKTHWKNLTFPNPEVEFKSNTKFLSLWDNWWSYGFVLGLLGLEWWIRRKWGLS